MRYSLLAIAMAATLLVTGCGDKTAGGDKATGDKAGSTTAATPAGENKSNGITGAVASFPQPIYAKLATDYKAVTGTQINYQSIGSWGGIKQIQANTVDFGASDAPMKPEELEKDGLIQFPTVIGGVVPVVNLEGIKPGELKLDGTTLAEIYLGKITKWNDPKIAALNAGLKLPDAAINTVFRADGSGTTYNFTNYLVSLYRCVICIICITFCNNLVAIYFYYSMGYQCCSLAIHNYLVFIYSFILINKFN